MNILMRELRRTLQLAYWVRFLFWSILWTGTVTLLDLKFSWRLFFLIMFMNFLGSTHLFPPDPSEPVE